MRKTYWIFLLVVGLLPVHTLMAQDPSFSQFFSSPLNVNPALTGNLNGQWRVISNFRNQWSGLGYPYNTGTISFDTKILRDRISETSNLGIGTMLMYDEAMNGVLKSIYASVNAAYNLQIAEDGNGGIHRLGIGIGGIYGHRRVDYSKLYFGQQFTGFGFDTNLPTGESSLSQMKPYFSVSAGLLYSYSSDYSNFDFGISGFHLNKPKQTFLEDKNQILPIRWVGHANYELFLNESLVLNTNAIYQKQSSTSYFSAGGGFGYFLSPDENILANAGLWYWSKNAIVTYAGFTYKAFQVGISYDITISKLNDAPEHPRTWEISLIIRGDHDERTKGIIPCPWR